MSLLSLAPLPVLIFIAGTAIVATGCGATLDLGADPTRRIEPEAARTEVDELRIDASVRASDDSEHMSARSNDGPIDIRV